jgi:hypothetical protein
MKIAGLISPPIPLTALTRPLRHASQQVPRRGAIASARRHFRRQPTCDRIMPDPANPGSG